MLLKVNAVPTGALGSLASLMERCGRRSKDDCAKKPLASIVLNRVISMIKYDDAKEVLLWFTAAPRRLHQAGLRLDQGRTAPWLDAGTIDDEPDDRGCLDLAPDRTLRQVRFRCCRGPGFPGPARPAAVSPQGCDPLPCGQGQDRMQDLPFWAARRGFAPHPACQTRRNRPDCHPAVTMAIARSPSFPHTAWTVWESMSARAPALRAP